MRIVALYLLIICFQPVIIAGSVKHVLKSDTSAIAPLKAQPAIMEKYWKSNDFQYSEEQPINLSFWDKILQRIVEFLRPLLSNQITGFFIKGVFILLFIGALILLLTGNKQWFWGRDKSTDFRAGVSFADDIQAPNFEDLIAVAVQNQNFNLAIRYQYLKLLQLLNNKKLIAWHNEKTNRDYLNEISATVYITDFLSITRVYEYIWYGKFDVSEGQFDEIHGRFNQFYKNLGE